MIRISRNDNFRQGVIVLVSNQLKGVTRLFESFFYAKSVSERARFT